MDTNDNIAPEVPVFAHRHYIDVDDRGRIVNGWLQDIRPIKKIFFSISVVLSIACCASFVPVIIPSLTWLLIYALEAATITAATTPRRANPATSQNLNSSNCAERIEI